MDTAPAERPAPPAVAPAPAGRLRGKRVVVTGGTSGIGEAIVRRFAEQGAAVLCCARGADAGAALEAALRGDAVIAAAGGSVAFRAADVTVRAEVEALVDDAVARWGGIDVVVANAGTGNGHPWPDEPDDAWQGIVSLNLDGMVNLCRAAWPHLLASGNGSIVAITSLSAWMAIGRDQLAAMGGQPSASYQASKAAMEGLVVHLAGRGGHVGIRANGVRPGRILTDRFRTWMGEDAVFWGHYREAQLIKRHGHVDDVANAALFFASDESSFVTGTVLDVNGGAVVKL